MNQTASSISTPPGWLLGCVTLIIAFCFISADSFWIDEGNAAAKALQPTIGTWHANLVSQGGSDAQMPGYMLYIWAWEKIFGSGEFALRASNIPWLLLAVFYLRRVPFLWLCLLASPFVLYYLNEFRPYMMQIGASAMILSCFLDTKTDPTRKWRSFLLGNFLLCASSLTGVIWSAGALIGFIWTDPTVIRTKPFWKDALIAAPLFLILGGYYLQTLLLGQGAALMGGGILLSLAACGYELSGLMGLGPGRIELREDPGSVKSYAIPLGLGIAFLGSAYLCGLVTALKQLSNRQRVVASVAILIPLAILAAIVLLKDFRLLARHLAPLAVIMPLLIAVLLAADRRQAWAPRIGGLLACLALLLGLISAASLRFSPRHKKDAYNEASAYAKISIAAGKTVFWAADAATANYYGLHPDNPDFHPVSPTAELNHITKPGVVILSKPDIYDPQGELRSHLDSKGFKLTSSYQAFTVYE